PCPKKAVRNPRTENLRGDTKDPPRADVKPISPALDPRAVNLILSPMAPSMPPTEAPQSPLVAFCGHAMRLIAYRLIPLAILIGLFATPLALDKLYLKAQGTPLPIRVLSDPLVMPDLPSEALDLLDAT